MKLFALDELLLLRRNSYKEIQLYSAKVISLRKALDSICSGINAYTG